MNAKTNNNTPVPAANMEQNSSYASERADAHEKANTPVSIHVHSVRMRPTDADGLSAKAAIDGLVYCGILRGDSPKEVNEVTFTQEKGKEEVTIITIEAMPDYWRGFP